MEAMRENFSDLRSTFDNQNDFVTRGHDDRGCVIWNLKVQQRSASQRNEYYLPLINSGS